MVSTVLVQEATMPEATSYRLTTSRGPIFTDHVVHATDSFAANLVPRLDVEIFPVRVHMTAQRSGTSFPDHGGARSWYFIHRSGFDHATQLPRGDDADTGSEPAIMTGGGLVQSPVDGLDEFGICIDDRSSFLVLHT